MDFDRLVDATEPTPLPGRDLGASDGRLLGSGPSWDYAATVESLLPVETLLDMGTGDGRFLSELDGRPAATFATEGWEPDVAVARARLEPLGIEVRRTFDQGNERLPFDDGAFDLVLDRHEPYSPEEVRRVLRPGGIFVTEQVGTADLADRNDSLDVEVRPRWDLAAAVDGLTAAGLSVIDAREERQAGYFTDVGAVALYLRIVPWRIPGLDSEGSRRPLRALRERMRTDGPLEVHSHRFLVVARSNGDLDLHGRVIICPLSDI